MLHDEFADLCGGALALGRIDQIALGGIDDLFQLTRMRQGAFRTRAAGRCRIFWRSKRSRRPSFLTTM